MHSKKVRISYIQCTFKSMHSFFLSLPYMTMEFLLTGTEAWGVFSEPLSLVLSAGLHDVTCMACCLEDNCVTCTAIMDHSMQSDC